MQLDDQVAIITGAARGIGQSTAFSLAREGARIVVADINEVGSEETVAEVASLGSSGLAITTDVTAQDQVNKMVARAASHFGRVDILVNNAGIAPLALLLDTTAEVWDQTIKTHLYGAFYCTQAVVPHMFERGGGRVVNISSVSGLVGSAARAAYGAAKGGLITFTKVLAVELAAKGIRVNAIAPGAVETELSKTAWTPADKEGYFRLTPVQRLGQPEDIAETVKFLCLPQSEYITGQVIAVDGGFSVAGIQWTNR